MQSAPALTVDVPSDRAWRLASHGLGAATGAVFGLWLAQRLEAPHAVAWFVAVLLAFVISLAAERMMRPRPGVLRWDGQGWWWQGEDAPPVAGSARVKIDLNHWLLVQFVPLGNKNARPRHQWLPMSRGSVGADWHALRATLYGRSAASPNAAVDAAKHKQP